MNQFKIQLLDRD